MADERCPKRTKFIDESMAKRGMKLRRRWPADNAQRVQTDPPGEEVDDADSADAPVR